MESCSLLTHDSLLCRDFTQSLDLSGLKKNIFLKQFSEEQQTELMRHGMNPTREDEEKSRVSAMVLLPSTSSASSHFSFSPSPSGDGGLLVGCDLCCYKLYLWMRDFSGFKSDSSCKLDSDCCSFTLDLTNMFTEV